MKTVQKCLLAATLLCVAPIAARADAAKVQVTALTVSQQIPAQLKPGEMFTKNELEQSDSNKGGTSMTVLISVPDKTIIEAVDQKSKLGSFTDDKGTNLYVPGERELSGDWMGGATGGVRVTDDGKFGVFSIYGNVPAQGATKVILAATLVLKCAGPLKTSQQTGVAIKDGAMITAGPVPLSISNIKFKGAKMGFTLTAHKSDNGATTKVAFLDAAGQEIPSSANNFDQESGASPGQYKESAEYTLARKVPAVTVKITYHTNLENVTVPVQVEAGLGLAQ